MIISSKKVTVMKAAEVASIMREVLQAESDAHRGREHFWVLGLNVNCVIQYVEIVSLGTLTSSLIYPR
jgi:DNA repair protein RadC